MNPKINERIVKHTTSIIDTLKQMDRIEKRILLVYKNKKYFNLISIGDIQRAIISNINMDTPISKIIRKNTYVASHKDSLDGIKKEMLIKKIELMPILNAKKELIDVLFWEDLFQSKIESISKKISLPVVIMAGGLGTRLKPITNVIPKPLIPIGQKTMIEEIFDRFSRNGCKEFYISVNYKADLIKYYLENLRLPLKIKYINEKKPLGTAGSLTFLKGKIDKTFFVNNCDILIDQDYSEILDFHYKNKNEITIVAALKNYKIPYGTIESGTNGKLVALKEKPDLTFKINSGMYLLEPHLLNEIPSNKELYHITDLIELIKKRKGKIGVFPVSEKSWMDVGEWDQYLKSIK